MDNPVPTLSSPDMDHYFINKHYRGFPASSWSLSSADHHIRQRRFSDPGGIFCPQDMLHPGEHRDKIGSKVLKKLATASISKSNYTIPALQLSYGKI
jgi:hypothetical protein